MVKYKERIQLLNIDCDNVLQRYRAPQVDRTGIFRVKNGILIVKSGKLRVENGIFSVKSGIFRVESGKLFVKS